MVGSTGRVVVSLSKDQLELVHHLGKRRNEKERLYGDGTYQGRDPLEVHKEGVASELAVATYFGTEIDENIYDHHGDDGIDLHLPEPIGLAQVKNTSWEFKYDPYLRLEMRCMKKCEAKDVQSAVGTMTGPDLGVVFILGWIPLPALKARPLKKLCVKGPWNYIAYEHELTRCKKSTLGD